MLDKSHNRVSTSLIPSCILKSVALMALSFLFAKLSPLPRVFSPTFDAVFSTLPFWQRWRLVLLQPINILAALLTSPSWLLNSRYSVIYIPTRNGKRRCLVFQPPISGKQRGKERKLRPLHIDIHGGGFVGGLPEHGARWCSLLSNRTGAVVVSVSYRFAPRYVYPAAHDDIDDIVIWLLEHAAKFGANAKLLTVGGSSVGGTYRFRAFFNVHILSNSTETPSNIYSPYHSLITSHAGNLALSACQYLHRTAQTMPLAYVGVCPALDLRLPPSFKPKPPNFPSFDPLSFLLPMYDIYAGTNRAQHLNDARLHPILAAEETLPRHMLVVAAGIDILIHEQLVFVERLKKDIASEGDTEGKVDLMVVEKGFHGFVECKHYSSIRV
jgi:acetyl esterase/lipase